MKLTGKAKIDFEKWMLKWLKDNIAFEQENPTQTEVEHFYTFPLAMQFSVYVDWAESVNILIDTQPVVGYDDEKYTEITEFVIHAIPLNVVIADEPLTFEKTRPEAREKAIEKLNKVYNYQKLK